MSTIIPPQPQRGFIQAEYEHRVTRAQRMMRAQQLDAILCTTEPNFRYFTGFHSQFWHSPTRPWYVLIPLEGKPIAVVPSIGKQALEETWLDEVYTWQSPHPHDEGITLLTQVIKQHCQGSFKLGMTLGDASHLRMPIYDWQRLNDAIAPISLVDAMPLLSELRNIKSDLEIDKIRYSCQLTSQAFANLSTLNNVAQNNMSERQLCQQMRGDLIELGADETPYLVAASGYGGYQSIITGPTDKKLVTNDIFMIDTGTIYDGYYCDFDRNYAIEKVPSETQKAHQTLYQATEKALSLAHQGNSIATLYEAMASTIEDSGINVSFGGSVGRFGHSIGMQLTEGFSIAEGDETPLEKGMVVAIEPSITYLINGEAKTLVHEENIAITTDEPELLTWRTPKEIPII